MNDETTAITISLPESLRKKIEQQAEKEDRTVSNYVRKLIKEILIKSEDRPHSERPVRIIQPLL